MQGLLICFSRLLFQTHTDINSPVILQSIDTCTAVAILQHTVHLHTAAIPKELTFKNIQQEDSSMYTRRFVFFIGLEGSNDWAIGYLGGLPDTQHTTNAMPEQLGKSSCFQYVFQP